MFGITDDHKNRWNDWLVNNSAKLLFCIIVIALNVVVIAERLYCVYPLALYDFMVCDVFWLYSVYEVYLSFTLIILDLYSRFVV